MSNPWFNLSAAAGAVALALLATAAAVPRLRRASGADQAPRFTRRLGPNRFDDADTYHEYLAFLERGAGRSMGHDTR